MQVELARETKTLFVLLCKDCHPVGWAFNSATVQYTHVIEL